MNEIGIIFMLMFLYVIKFFLLFKKLGICWNVLICIVWGLNCMRVLFCINRLMFWYVFDEYL